MRTILSAAAFIGTATVILACLKLGGLVTWSWWTVFAPLWAPAAFYLTGWLMIGGWILLCTIARRHNA